MERIRQADLVYWRVRESPHRGRWWISRRVPLVEIRSNLINRTTNSYNLFGSTPKRSRVPDSCGKSWEPQPDRSNQRRWKERYRSSRSICIWILESRIEFRLEHINAVNDDWSWSKCSCSKLIIQTKRECNQNRWSYQSIRTRFTIQVIQSNEAIKHSFTLWRYYYKSSEYI